MDKNELIIDVETKQGKNRTKKGKKSFLCLGALDLSAGSIKTAAIQLTRDGQFHIDKDKCSKCYLCKLKSKHIALDDNHLPYITEEEDNKRYILEKYDQINFETCLATYTEETGISKWVYSIFRIFGIMDTFTECAISKEFIPKNILEALGRSVPDGIYGKSVIPDVEGRTEDFVFVFENKKYNPSSDKWVIEAIKQIILYAYSSIYKEEENKVIFVFCYNGSRDIEDKIKIVLAENPELKGYLYKIFKENSNYTFSLLPSSELYTVVEMALKENKKEMAWIVDVIRKNVKNLP